MVRQVVKAEKPDIDIIDALLAACRWHQGMEEIRRAQKEYDYEDRHTIALKEAGMYKIECKNMEK